jgi:hypothetical protein
MNILLWITGIVFFVSLIINWRSRGIMERVLVSDEREFLKSLKMGTLISHGYNINVNLNGHIRTYESILTDLTVISKLGNNTLTYHCKTLKVARVLLLLCCVIFFFLLVIKNT